MIFPCMEMKFCTILCMEDFGGIHHISMHGNLHFIRDPSWHDILFRAFFELKTNTGKPCYLRAESSSHHTI